MIADQRPVFGPWPEALFGSESVDPASLPEAVQDPDEVERVDDFLTTIAEIEELTGLDCSRAWFQTASAEIFKTLDMQGSCFAAPLGRAGVLDIWSI